MPVKDEDLEVIEETVNDFEYFYEEDETIKRNRKIIIKYKIISVCFIVFILMFLLTVLGICRMKIYGTNNILTHDEMAYIETKQICEEVMSKSQDFYSYNSSSNSFDETCAYANIKNNLLGNKGKTLGTEGFQLEFSLDSWTETFESYVGSSETIGVIDIETMNLPKKKDFTGLIWALNDFVNEENNMINFIIENYDDITEGKKTLDTNERNLNTKFKELATQYMLLTSE